MAGFSAADAAFTGFRIVWERPWAVAIWAGAQFVVSFAISLFVAFSAGPAIQRLYQLVLQQPSADPGPLLSVMRRLAPTSMVLVIVSLVLAAVFTAAMNRAVMRPQQSRFGYLRLATDELRQLGLLTVLLLALYLGIIVVAVVLTALFAAGGAVGAAGLAVGLPATLCGCIFLGVRFSLASPTTFATGRINIFGSWRMTHGRFWPLFGAYALAIALSLVVGALTLVIAVLAVGIAGGGFGGVTPAAHADVSSVAAMLAPGQLVYLAISSVGAALRMPVILCPPAAIYRSLAGGGPAAVGKVFD